MRRTLATLAIAGLTLGIAANAGADGTSATITGTVGENVSTTDGYDGRHLRYVGDPAPTGYADFYQHGEHVLTTSPEEGPVTMAGTLDVSAMSSNGQVAVIGLHDADALKAGDRGDKAEVGIYVNHRIKAGVTTYRIGVTDGDAGGGEFVQRFTDFTAAELAASAHVLDVALVVDGTADPATCADDPADVATADGCMTLTVNGRTVSDSYGTIAPTDIVIETELGNGAHPGWYSAYESGTQLVGVDFDLEVSPIVVNAPQSANDCKKGGYEAFGFRNQGQCVSSVRANARSGK